MKNVVSKIDNLFEAIDTVANVDNEYLDIHDDIRIHVYYDEDGWVWDAIEGEYIIAMSDVAFDTIEEAEADAKAYVESDKYKDESPEQGEM
jgi:hypothetical protein